VAASGAGGGDVLARLTDLYTGARFGRRAVGDESLRELAARLSELGGAAKASDQSSARTPGAPGPDLR
jgi:hypothetical protein